MQKAEKRLSLILKKLNNSDIPNDAIASLGIVRVLCGTDKFLKGITVLSSLSICMLLVPALVMLSSYFYTNEVRLIGFHEYYLKKTTFSVSWKHLLITQTFFENPKTATFASA